MSRLFCFVGTVGLEPTTRVAFTLFFFPAGFQLFMFSFLLHFYIILRRFCADFYRLRIFVSSLSLKASEGNSSCISMSKSCWLVGATPRNSVS